MSNDFYTEADMTRLYLQDREQMAQGARLVARPLPEWLITFFYGDQAQPVVVTLTAPDAAQAISQFQRDYPGLAVYQVAQVVETRHWVLKD